jgi:hypothetical protein
LSPEESGTGGAAKVGNSELKSTVEVGWAGGIGVGENVAVGKNGCSVGTSMKYREVGVACDLCGGWKGVRVGEAFGAAVISTMESDAGAAAGATPQDVKNRVVISAARQSDVFGIKLSGFEMTYGYGVAVGKAVMVGVGSAGAGVQVNVSANVALGPKVGLGGAKVGRTSVGTSLGVPKIKMIVTLGVMVAEFGTHRTCPTAIKDV